MEEQFEGEMQRLLLHLDDLTREVDKNESIIKCLLEYVSDIHHKGLMDVMESSQYRALVEKIKDLKKSNHSTVTTERPLLSKSQLSRLLDKMSDSPILRKSDEDRMKASMMSSELVFSEDLNYFSCREYLALLIRALRVAENNGAREEAILIARKMESGCALTFYNETKTLLFDKLKRVEYHPDESWNIIECIIRHAKNLKKFNFDSHVITLLNGLRRYIIINLSSIKEKDNNKYLRMRQYVLMLLYELSAAPIKSEPDFEDNIYLILRNDLKNIRSRVHSNFINKGTDYDLVKNELRWFITEIIMSCENFLGTAPCAYSFCLLGSVVRGDATPYSDVEFIVLIEKDTSECRNYFFTLLKLFHIKVMSLCESDSELIGFHLDLPDGCVGDSNPLIVNTPIGMAKQLRSSLGSVRNLNSSEMIFLRSVLNADWGFGSRELFEVFTLEASKILQEESNGNYYYEILGKSIIINYTWGNNDNEIFDIKYQRETQKESQIEFSLSIKQYLLVPLVRLLTGLKIYYQLPEVQCIDIIDKLVTRGILDIESGHYLVEIYKWILRQRVLLHLERRCASDSVPLSSPSFEEVQNMRRQVEYFRSFIKFTVVFQEKDAIQSISQLKKFPPEPFQLYPSLAVSRRVTDWEMRISEFLEGDASENEVELSWLTRSGYVKRGRLKEIFSKQIFDRDGLPRNDVRHQSGRCWVGYFFDESAENSSMLCFVKLFPHTPLRQLSVDLLTEELSGLSGLATLAKIKHPRCKFSYPVLLSHPQGRTLQECHLSGNNQPERSLDPYYFTWKFIESIIIFHSDEKTDNVVPVNVGRQIVDTYGFICIDASEVFESQPFVDGKLQCYSVVWLCDQMDQKFDKNACVRYLDWNIDVRLQSWGNRLQYLTKNLVGSTDKSLFTLEEISQFKKQPGTTASEIQLGNDYNRECDLTQGFRNCEPAEVQQRALQLQDLLKDSAGVADQCDHWRLLEQFHHGLASVYRLAKERASTCVERFNALPQVCENFDYRSQVVLPIEKSLLKMTRKESREVVVVQSINDHDLRRSCIVGMGSELQQSAETRSTAASDTLPSGGLVVTLQSRAYRRPVGLLSSLFSRRGQAEVRATYKEYSQQFDSLILQLRQQQTFKTLLASVQEKNTLELLKNPHVCPYMRSRVINQLDWVRLERSEINVASSLIQYIVSLRLTRLDLVDCNSVNNYHIETLCKRSSTLNWVRFDNTPKITVNIFVPLSWLPNLTYCEIRRLEWGQVDNKPKLKFMMLTQLIIGGCTNLRMVSGFKFIKIDLIKVENCVALTVINFYVESMKRIEFKNVSIKSLVINDMVTDSASLNENEVSRLPLLTLQRRLVIGNANIFSELTLPETQQGVISGDALLNIRPFCWRLVDQHSQSAGNRFFPLEMGVSSMDNEDESPQVPVSGAVQAIIQAVSVAKIRELVLFECNLNKDTLTTLLNGNQALKSLTLEMCRWFCESQSYLYGRTITDIDTVLKTAISLEVLKLLRLKLTRLDLWERSPYSSNALTLMNLREVEIGQCDRLRVILLGSVQIEILKLYNLINLKKLEVKSRNMRSCVLNDLPLVGHHTVSRLLWGQNKLTFFRLSKLGSPNFHHTDEIVDELKAKTDLDSNAFISYKLRTSILGRPVKPSALCSGDLFCGRSEKEKTIRYLLENHISGNFSPYRAVNDEDNFFDAFCLSLTVLNNRDIRLTIQQVRQLCFDLANSLDRKCNHQRHHIENWLGSMLPADSYINYLKNVRYSRAEDVSAKPSSTRILLIQGRPEIDGVFLCSLNLQIHIVEVVETLKPVPVVRHRLITKKGPQTINNGDVEFKEKGEDTVHLLVYKNHYVPILRKSFVMAMENGMPEKIDLSYHEEDEVSVSKKPLSIHNDL